MRKRVILILVLLAVLTGIIGGVWWYVRSNSGFRLFKKVEVAMQAKQYDHALDLAAEYARKYPDEWHGHDAVGQAMISLGRFEEARAPLERASQIDPTQASVWLRLADTYALPARRAVDDRRTREQSGLLRKAVADLRQATLTLRGAKVSRAGALDIQECEGKTLLYTSIARDLLSRRLRVEARYDESAGRTADRDRRRREADEEEKAAEDDFIRCRDLLVDLVRTDPSRDTAAYELVQACVNRQDQAGLEMVSAAVMSVPEANRPPQTATLLAIQEVSAFDPGVPSSMRKAKIARAVRDLDSILARHPDQPDIMVARARLAIREDDAEKALELCRKVLSTQPEHRMGRLVEAQALFSRGLPERDEPNGARVPGDLGVAENKLIALYTEYRKWDEPHYVLAMVLDKAGDKDPARKDRASRELRDAVDMDPANMPAQRLLVQWCLRDGKQDEAFKHARVLYQSDPRNSQSIQLMVRAAQDANEPELARAALEDTRRDPRYSSKPECLMAVAEGYRALGQGEQERRVAEQASTAPAATEESRIAQANAFMVTRRLAEATALAESLVKDRPSSSRARWVLGQTYWLTGKRMDALEQYRKVVALDEDNVLYRAKLADALMDVGFVEESIRECDRILQQDPRNAAILLLKGRGEAARGGDADAAISQALDAPGVSPAMAAQLLLLRGRADRCVEICREELRKWPDANESRRWDDVRVLHELLVQGLLARGDAAEAAKECKALLAADPDRLQPYRWMADILRADGPLDAVGAALATMPGARAPMVDLAMAEAFFRDGRYDLAAQAARRAAPREGVSDDIRGRALRIAVQASRMAGQGERALEDLESLAAVKGWRVAAMLQKAEVLRGLRRDDEAKGILAGLRKNFEAEEDTVSMASLAGVYARVGWWEDANSVCESLIRAMPNDARPCLLRADVLLRAGLPAQALEWRRQAVKRAPDSLDARVALARSLEDSLDVAGALAELRAMASFRQSWWNSAASLQTLLYVRQGLFAPAVWCVEELASQEEAADPRNRLAVAQSLVVLGRRHEAAANIEKIPRFSPQYVAGQQLLAALAENDKARLAILDRLAVEKMETPAVLAQRMTILLRLGMPGDAAGLFMARATSQPAGQPTPSETAQLATQALFEAGQRKEAAALAARMAAETRLPQWRRFACLLLADQDLPAARAMLGEPDAAGPIDAMLGVVLWRGEPAARQWLARAEPNAGGAAGAGVPVHYRAIAWAALGDAERAQALLARVRSESAPTTVREATAQIVAMAKADPNAAAMAGGLLRSLLAAEMGLPSAGTAWAMEILKSRPDCQLAVVAAIGAQPDTATLKAILDLAAPGSAVAEVTRANWLLRQDKFDDAADALTTLARANPGDVELAMQKGTALELAGKFPEALETYREVLKSRSVVSAANNAACLIGQLYPRDANRLAEALDLADRAVKAMPGVASFHETRGWIACLLGQHELARRELRAAITGLSTSAEAHCHLGLAEAAPGGSPEMALLHLEAAVAISIGLPPEQAKGLLPAARRAGEQASEALKGLSTSRPATLPARRAATP
jgi:tetratricopeptide (TPR) repeat protein